MKRILGRLLKIGILAAGLIASGPAIAADFDFYVLSLSWSPTWCATNDSDGQTPQCNGKRRYGLIVHGFWPQYERGFPQDCPSSEPDRVPGSLLRGYYDIIPSAGLAGHEWRKHGTCSGLSPDQYFALARKAFEKIKVPAQFTQATKWQTVSPPEVENAFRVSNPGLEDDMISVTCDRRNLREVRICFTKELEFRRCPQVDRQACRNPRVSLPPVRG